MPPFYDPGHRRRRRLDATPTRATRTLTLSWRPPRRARPCHGTAAAAELAPRAGPRSAYGPGSRGRCRGDERTPRTGWMQIEACEERARRTRLLYVRRAPRGPGSTPDRLDGAAPESNSPSRGLHDRTGFEV